MLKRVPAPTVIVVLTLIVIATATTIMFLGAFHVGATWDERAHLGMLQTYFETGWNVGPDWLVNGELDPFTGKWPYFVYAPVASLLIHLSAAISGNEPWGGFSTSPEAFAARHVMTALIALVGIAAAGAIAWLITRSWRWGLVAAALLASTPMWIGHGMFNVKDLPVGTGYTVATLGFVLMCRDGYGGNRQLRVLAWMSVVAGVVLAVGTRPASGLPIALTGVGILMFCLVVLALRRRHSRLVELRPGPRAVDVLGSLLLAYLTLIAIYPKGFINPLRLVKETLLLSGRFPVTDAELTNGVWLPQPPPWYYLPTWFAAQLPLLLLIGCLIFLVLSFVVIVKRIRRPWPGLVSLGPSLLIVPVVAQLLLMSLLAVLAHSTIYDATRQFLFVVPAAAVLAALGLRSVIGRVAGRRALLLFAWILVSVGLVMPVVDQVRLFPYSYVYFNELASLKPIDGNWATDYWRASGRELVPLIPVGETSCIFIDANHAERPCDVDSTFSPFWASQGIQAKPGQLAEGEYWLVRENNGDVTAPQGCSLHDQLTRPLRGQTLVISQIFRCAHGASS